jgi:hypothetical protein
MSAKKRRMRTSLRNCFRTATQKINFLPMAVTKMGHNETTHSGVTNSSWLEARSVLQWLKGSSADVLCVFCEKEVE